MCINRVHPRDLCNNNECIYCYNKSLASHPKASWWSTRNQVTPRDVFKNCTKETFWFVCGKCTHGFDTTPTNMIGNKGCGYCGGKRICGCSICFPKSFATMPYSKCIADPNINPALIFKKSSDTITFKCNICTHAFVAEPRNMLGPLSYCVYCPDGKGLKKVCDDLSCPLCQETSFASSHRAQSWVHEKNNGMPRNYRKSSNSIHWFKCDQCEHEFDASLDHITLANEWCPYCAIPSRKSCNENCKYCFQRSFASHDKAKFWSHKNDRQPRQVRKSSHDHYIFNCDIHQYEFKSRACDITNSESWCPLCATPSEANVFVKLRQVYPSLGHQLRADWCMRDRCLPFDFVIEDLKIIIELDGPQHFKQVSDWDPPEVTCEVDIFKTACANAKGYSVIRIIQEDVSGDKYPWLDELVDNIKKITAAAPNIQNIFMCKNSEYESMSG